MNTEDWPTWATEHVEIAAYDPDWPAHAEQQRNLLEPALAPWLVGHVEHIGSTAVPGLAAKPILDFQAQVTTLDCAPHAAATLTPQGWHFVPVELDQRPWRRFFVHVANNHRHAHLHLLNMDAPQWHEGLAFRDALRADPTLADAYAALKTDLAAHYHDDRETYTREKADFVRHILTSR